VTATAQAGCHLSKPDGTSRASKFPEQRCPSDRACLPTGTDTDQAEAGLGVLRAMQPRHRAHLLRQRCPPGDGPSARSRLRIVANPGKPPTQLDHSRQLALLVEDGADRSSISLVDDKHPRTMAMQIPVGKRGVLALWWRASPDGSRASSGAAGAGDVRWCPRPLAGVLERQDLCTAYGAASGPGGAAGRDAGHGVERLAEPNRQIS
jgi:hypothetical protein